MADGIRKMMARWDAEDLARIEARKAQMPLHECPDWDGLEIDHTCPEAECCTCDKARFPAIREEEDATTEEMCSAIADITITIEGPPKSGKSSAALAIKDALARFGTEVFLEDMGEPVIDRDHMLGALSDMVALVQTKASRTQPRVEAKPDITAPLPTSKGIEQWARAQGATYACVRHTMEYGTAVLFLLSSPEVSLRIAETLANQQMIGLKILVVDMIPQYVVRMTPRPAKSIWERFANKFTGGTFRETSWLELIP